MFYGQLEAMVSATASIIVDDCPPPVTARQPRFPDSSDYSPPSAARVKEMSADARVAYLRKSVTVP